MFKKVFLKKIHSLLDYIENPLLMEARFKRIPMEFVRMLFEIKTFLPEVHNVFDIGAASGNFVLAVHFVYPKSNIFAFEPLPEKVEILQEIFSRQKISGRVYNLALASSQGETFFTRTKYTNLSSILEPDQDLINLFGDRANYEKIKVVKKRFDSIFELDANSVNFAKIDVQGYELEVLKGMGEELSKIQGVMLEVNFDRFYIGQPSYFELIEYLYYAGFKRFYQIDKIVVNGKVSWCDLVFFR